MEWSSFLLMRHELVLTGAILLLLMAEIFMPATQKAKLIPIVIVLFGVHMITGFLPLDEGTMFGGMFQTTAMHQFAKNILNLGVFIVLLQSADWLKNTVLKEDRLVEFYLLIGSTLLGMYFMISAGDFLMLFIGLELASLPLAALAAYNIHNVKSAEAGIKFILSAALASGIMIFGISMIYGSTGSIYFDEVAGKMGRDSMSILAFMFFMSGLAFKISLVPFHFWTADVYEGAPTNVTSYLSVVSKGAAVFILMIVLITVMPALQEIWKALLYVLSILTMVVGNLFALRQQNMKRFLAFSSIAQAGFILLGLLAANQSGMTTVIYFVLIYVFSNLGAFGVVHAIANHTGKENMADYEGLYRTNPKLSLVLLISLFSLAGIPPLAGFFGKFFLFIEAASQGYYWLVLIAVLNVTISLFYYLLPVRAMFLRKSDQAIPHFDSDMWMQMSLVLCVIGILAIGFYSPVYAIIYEIVGTYL